MKNLSFLIALSIHLAIIPFDYIVFADEPIVIAHRGASGYRPEHTIGAYELAILQGADYIEPDLVITKDGYLIARHDIYLSTTTNVADLEQFANRKREFEGHNDWFAFDFTLAEIKQLRTKQPRENRSKLYDGIETVPTFDEVLNLVTNANTHGRNVGIYPEIKNPKAHKSQGLDPEKAIVSAMKKIAESGIKAYLQCFDGEFLLNVASKISVPSVLLIGGEYNRRAQEWRDSTDLSSYQGRVAGIGINKAILFGASSNIVEKAHAFGMKVHIWTMRSDSVPNVFLNEKEEMVAIEKFNVDGYFTDFPDNTRAILNALEK